MNNQNIELTNDTVDGSSVGTVDGSSVGTDTWGKRFFKRSKRICRNREARSASEPLLSPVKLGPKYFRDTSRATFPPVFMYDVLIS